MPDELDRVTRDPLVMSGKAVHPRAPVTITPNKVENSHPAASHVGF